MQEIMNRLLNSLVAAAAILAASSAYSLSPARARGVEVTFLPLATSLTEEQRSRIQYAVEELRQKDWCWFGAAIVTGFSNDSEGKRKRQDHLALARAQYVAGLLELYGIPRSHVYSYIGPNPDGKWAYDAAQSLQFISVEFNATSRLGIVGPCPVLDTPSGLRLSPLDGHPHK